MVKAIATTIDYVLVGMALVELESVFASALSIKLPNRHLTSGRES